MDDEDLSPFVEQVTTRTERYNQWGVHLSLDCAGCKNITDRQAIYDFTVELVKAIDMVAYGEPQIVHFAEHDPSKAGYTLVQLIETSAITAHFVDATGEAYIDIFSCKEFSEYVVFDIVNKYFEPKSITHNVLIRGVWSEVNEPSESK
jgi:S-adenosylmethionine/arginine decarboxylase-like enzyme